MGNRIAKHIYTPDATPWTGPGSWDANWERSVYYVRDATGNVMATYEKQMDNNLLTHKLTERPIYGSSRLGLYTKTVEMIGAIPIGTTLTHTVGKRHYELTNHLGNVLTIITDQKINLPTPQLPPWPTPYP